jgi:hypothetical protein
VSHDEHDDWAQAQMKTNTQFVSFALAVSLVACGQLNHAGGDDEYGDPVEQTPDDFNVPDWPDARIRLANYEPYAGDQPNELNGVIVDEELAATAPEEREYAAFSPSTPPQPDHQTGKCVYCGWPSKPWMKGIPEIPYWTWNAQHAPTANGAWATAKSDWGGQQGDLRSGLVGNYGVYMPSTASTGNSVLYCPDEHPRPPICSNLWMQVGHPLIAGRYNLYGLACSTARLGIFDDEDPNDDCMRHYDVGISLAAPGYPTVWGVGSYAQCLALGETYRPEIGLLTQHTRNGLTWLNLREMHDLLNFLADTAEPAEILLEAIPWWDYAASQWNYVNIDDTPWRHSEWSKTGECSFPSAISIAHSQPTDISIPPCHPVTRHPCPETHTAVLPPFNQAWMLASCADNESYSEEVVGFCGLPYFDWVANEAALMPDGSIDPIVQFDLANNGYHRGFNLRLDAMPDELIEEWSQSVLFVPTDDGVRLDLPRVAAGDQVAAARYATGLALLAEFGLKPGDRIVSIDHDIDLRDASATPMDALLLVLDRWSTAQEDGQPTMTSLWIERDDGWVLPTYLFPVYRPLPPDPTVADDGTDDTTSG